VRTGGSIPESDARFFLPGHALLRGLLAICVFLGHAQFASLWPANESLAAVYDFISRWSIQAVDIFFVLSGFILLHVHRPRAPAEWRRYFVSRIARIHPLFLATTVRLAHFHDCSSRCRSFRRRWSWRTSSLASCFPPSRSPRSFKSRFCEPRTPLP